jgi:hypothetical protein
MPRNIRWQLQPAQRPTHLPCATPSTDQISDLTVGGKSTMGDLSNDQYHPFIKIDQKIKKALILRLYI